MISRAFLFAAILGSLGFVASSAGSTESPPCEVFRDEQRRTFRVGFDPWSEVHLGLVSGVARYDHAWSTPLVVRHGLSYRGLPAFEEKGERIRWQLDHRLLWGRFRIAPQGFPGLDAFLYQGTYLRHTDSPFVMLPTSPPQRLYFPFDVGIEALAGRLRVRARDDEKEHIRVGAAQALILLDPLRSNRPGNSVEIGVGVRYDIDLIRSPTQDPRAANHKVAPFTATSLRWRAQDARGILSADTRFTWFPHWASSGSWQIREWEAEAQIRRTLVAINDQPLSLVVDAGANQFAVDDPSVEPWDLRIFAGLSLGIQLKEPMCEDASVSMP